MKSLFILLTIVWFSLLLVGCEGGRQSFGYKSSNCNDVKQSCLDKCRKDNKSQNLCLSECEKVRGMCEAVKTKGCLQDCNMKFGKGSQEAERCKKRCSGEL